MSESRILYETKNLWCERTAKDKYSINVHAGTHSLRIGDKATLEGAKKFMDKLERYPDNIELLVPMEYRFKIRIEK